MDFSSFVIGFYKISTLLFLLSSICMEAGKCQPASSQLPCSDQSFGLSMIGKRNQTGHFITKYSVSKSAQHSLWKLDIQTCIHKNGESQMFNLQATVTAAPPKPDDYEFFPGVGYYKLYTNPATFGEALHICSKDGGHLAIINSVAEYNVLQSIRRQNSKASPVMFLGFHDQIKEGEYITIFGHPLNSTGFLKWNPNDPNGGKENCGGLVQDSFLCDVGCEVKLSFFCEYDLSWNELA